MGSRAAAVSFPAQAHQKLPLSFSCIFLGDPGRVTGRWGLGVAAIGRWGGVLEGRGRAGLAGRSRGSAGRPAGVWPRGGNPLAATAGPGRCGSSPAWCGWGVRSHGRRALTTTVASERGGGGPASPPRCAAPARTNPRTGAALLRRARSRALRAAAPFGAAAACMGARAPGTPGMRAAAFSACTRTRAPRQPRRAIQRPRATSMWSST